MRAGVGGVSILHPPDMHCIALHARKFLFMWGNQHCKRDLETDGVDHSALCVVSCMHQCSHRILCRLLAGADICCAALCR